LLKRCLVLPVLIIASSLAFVACGSSGNSDEDQIVEAIETSATSTNPADCSKFSTQAFMEQSTSETGQKAVKSCEEDASKPNNAESVDVSEVEVEGSKATADGAVTGGSFDGQTVTISLVKEGDQWKLDQITGFAAFDQAKLVKAFETELTKPSSELSQAQSSCIIEALEEASQEEFEELLLSGSSEPLGELVESCS
jgi:hypothetical protein